MVYPRTTTGQDWYCAELVAACLKAGGLMHPASNPGAATPHSLYKMYKAQGAVMANPCTLRQEFGHASFGLGAPATGASFFRQAARRASSAPPARPTGESAATLQAQLGAAKATASSAGRRSERAADAPRRSDSPPRMRFKVLQARGAATEQRAGQTPIAISLASLSMQSR